MSTTATTHNNAAVAKFTGNDLTTGNAVEISATSLTTGSALKITTTDTGTKALEIAKGLIVYTPQDIELGGSDSGDIDSVNSGAPDVITPYSSVITFTGSGSTYFGELTSYTPTTGTMLNLFYASSVTSLRIDFGTDSLTSASGATNQYLTFTTDGQSASLVYISANGELSIQVHLFHNSISNFNILFFKFFQLD